MLWFKVPETFELGKRNVGRTHTNSFRGVKRIAVIAYKQHTASSTVLTKQYFINY